MAEFKYRLRDLREQKRVSGAKLGEILGVGKSTVSMWENGKNYPTAIMLQKLATYFNVSTDYLLGKTDIKNELLTSISLDEFEVAFHGEVKDLSPEAKEKVLEYARLLKFSEDKNKK